jgi:hypothetical protein
MRWREHAARMVKTLGRPERRWVNNIKIDLGEREREDGVIWTGLIWLRIGISGGLL